MVTNSQNLIWKIYSLTQLIFICHLSSHHVNSLIFYHTIYFFQIYSFFRVCSELTITKNERVWIWWIFRFDLLDLWILSDKFDPEKPPKTFFNLRDPPILWARNCLIFSIIYSTNPSQKIMAPNLTQTIIIVVFPSPFFFKERSNRGNFCWINWRMERNVWDGWLGKPSEAKLWRQFLRDKKDIVEQRKNGWKLHSGNDQPK